MTTKKSFMHYLMAMTAATLIIVGAGYNERTLLLLCLFELIFISSVGIPVRQRQDVTVVVNGAEVEIE